MLPYFDSGVNASGIKGLVGDGHAGYAVRVLFQNLFMGGVFFLYSKEVILSKPGTLSIERNLT